MSYYFKKDAKKTLPLIIIFLLIVLFVLFKFIINVILENNFKNEIKKQIEIYLKDDIYELDILKINNKTNLKYGKITKDKNITVANVSNGKYCANGDLKKLSIKKGECIISAPTCSLFIESGTLGINDYYTSKVIIRLKTSVAKINGIYYGLDEKETYESNLLKENQIGILKYEVNKSGDYLIKGFVKDLSNQKNTCDISLKIDLEKPSINGVSINQNKLTFTLKDNIGIIEYAIKEDNNFEKKDYSKIKSIKEKTVTINIEKDKEYYISVKDEAGNILTNKLNVN